MHNETTEGKRDLARAIGASAHDQLQALSPLSRLRALRGKDPGYDRDVWVKLVEAGWTGVLVAEQHGGLGLGLDAACAIAEQVGRHPLPEPYLAAGIQAPALLSRLPGNAMRDCLLEKIAAGELIVGVAWQEFSSGKGRNSAYTETDQNGELQLSCVRQWVYPARADGWLVVCEREKLILWVPAGTEGVDVVVHERVDGSLASTLTLTNVRIAAAHCIADGDVVIEAGAYANHCARVAQAAELVGIAHKAFELTLAYLKTRSQFGKPIGSNQALQHRMVDAYLQIRLADAVLAEFLSTSGQTDAMEQAHGARVKARCAHAAVHMARLAIQFHGAIGYTDELDVGLYLKRALHLTSWLGGARESRLLAIPLIDKLGPNQSDSAPQETRTDTDWNALPEHEFRAVVRHFIRDHYPEALRNPPKRLHWDEIKTWYLALSRQGWIAPAWPKEHGGMGLTPGRLIVFIEEMEAYGVARMPDQGIINIGPVLIRYGTEAQRRKFLPKILSGENIWCQGYSEPNAGSDLASLRTEAVADGDCFVVNGQKIWTTLAQDATHIFMLVRTDKAVKKQGGISFLLADMSTPGITVRPIRNIGGEEEFCEVFFDNVRVPAENLVGKLNDGWSIAKALLDFERIFVGSPSQSWFALHQLEQVGRSRQLFEDRVFKDRFVGHFLDVLDLQALYGEYAEIVKRGESLPPSVSLLKIWATETYSRICMESVEYAGESGGDERLLLGNGAAVHPAQRLYNSAITTIYGGTNEIQRNILSKLVLELPI